MRSRLYSRSAGGDVVLLVDPQQIVIQQDDRGARLWEHTGYGL